MFDAQETFKGEVPKEFYEGKLPQKFKDYLEILETIKGVISVDDALHTFAAIYPLGEPAQDSYHLVLSMFLKQWFEKYTELKMDINAFKMHYANYYQVLDERFPFKK